MTISDLKKWQSQSNQCLYWFNITSIQAQAYSAMTMSLPYFLFMVYALIWWKNISLLLSCLGILVTSQMTEMRMASGDKWHFLFRGLCSKWSAFCTQGCQWICTLELPLKFNDTTASRINGINVSTQFQSKETNRLSSDQKLNIYVNNSNKLMLREIVEIRTQKAKQGKLNRCATSAFESGAVWIAKLIWNELDECMRALVIAKTHSKLVRTAYNTILLKPETQTET